MPPTFKYVSSRSARWAVAGVLAIALALRAWGIAYDLPSIYHPDEASYINISLNMLKTGNPNPHFFNYPSLFFYLNSLSQLIDFLLARLKGVAMTVADLYGPSVLDMGVARTPMPNMVLGGRLVTLLVSIGSLALTYHIGRRLTGQRVVGLLAAAMLAVLPVHVANSRNVLPNPLAVFFVLATTAAALRILERGLTQDYVLAGLCAGLAASSKYNAGLVVIAPIAAHLLRLGWSGLKDVRVYVVALFAIVGFLIGTPYALIERAAFLEAVRFEVHHYASGHAGQEGETLRWYLAFFWRDMNLLAPLALVEGARSIYVRPRSRATLLIALFPLAYFAMISRFVVRSGQTALPMMPSLCILAATFLARLLDRARAMAPGRMRVLCQGIWAMGLIAMLLPLSVRVVQENTQLTTIDSRETARVWIEANLPTGSRIAIEPYTPWVDPERFQIVATGPMRGRPSEWYRENGVDYMIFGEWTFARFFAAPDRYSLQASQYRALWDRYELVKRFDDGGYEVLIYRVR